MTMLKQILLRIYNYLWAQYSSLAKYKRLLYFFYLSIRYRIIKVKLRRKIKREPINIGFLGYLDGPSCDVFTSLYEEFSKDKRFNCSIVVVPYSHDEKKKMIEKQELAANYLIEKGFSPFLGYDKTADTYIDYSGRFDIVFFEIEYDWVLDIFKVENFRDALSFVIPYGQYLANNISHHLSCKMMSEVYKVFPTSVSVGRMMKKYSLINGLNIHSQYLGNPKIDRFFMKPFRYKDVLKKATAKQKKLIWAPHHTWAPYSNFLQYSKFFLDLAEQNQEDLFIVIKPHPALRDSLKVVNGWSDNDINSYFNQWTSKPNTDLFEGEWYDLFLSSDAMILDSIGFMLEYSLTGKPACVIYRNNEINQRTMKFSQCGEDLYELLYHASSTNEILSFIEMIKEDDDKRKTERMKYIMENYCPPNNKAGYENIYDYLVTEVLAQSII